MTSAKAVVPTACALLTACLKLAHADVHADADSKSRLMQVTRTPITYDLGPLPPHFERDIPRLIHVAQLHPNMNDSTAIERAWRAYAEATGYRLRFWRPHDVHELADAMGPELHDVVLRAWSQGQTQFVHYAVQAAVLASFGGIFVDSALWPPHRHSWVDFEAIVPLKGLVLMTDWHGRDVGRSSLFATDKLIMAEPEHPVMVHMLHALKSNHDRLSSFGLSFEPHYDGGAFVLNRALSGTLTVVSVRDWDALGIFGPSPELSVWWGPP